MLVSMGLPDETAEAVCSVCVTANQLPQALTSPILSNLVTYRLD